MCLSREMFVYALSLPLCSIHLHLHYIYIRFNFHISFQISSWYIVYCTISSVWNIQLHFIHSNEQHKLAVQPEFSREFLRLILSSSSLNIFKFYFHTQQVTGAGWQNKNDKIIINNIILLNLYRVKCNEQNWLNNHSKILDASG